MIAGISLTAALASRNWAALAGATGAYSEDYLES